ncbi:LEAF RUST 10 DISEASE-RESISTANCE LOCUS RECEPTOR-LIKE PROTEIN KINASE-like 2.4 isoform X1 [Fagus crenata]
MARGLPFTTGGLTALIALLLVQETFSTDQVNHLLVHESPESTDHVNHQCPPSSCGNIHTISYPFRLKSDPDTCGDIRFNLSCENNLTVLNLSEFGPSKYYVQEINYNNYTIWIVDSGIQKDNYSSTPTYSLNRFKFSPFTSVYTTYQPKRTKRERNPELSRSVVLMSCEKPLNSPFYLDTSTCNNSSNISSSHSMRKRYRYVKVGTTKAADVEESCKVEQMFRTSWPRSDDPNNISCKDIHNELVYGFELSWLEATCDNYCGRMMDSCYLNGENHVHCKYSGK